MKNSLDQFNKNMDAIKSIDAIYVYMEKSKLAFDLSELLRSQFVLIVSAIDCFVHDVVRLGLLDILEGKRAKGKAFKNFKVSLDVVDTVLKTSTRANQLAILEAEIRKVSSKDSYQKPTSIETALSLISIDRLWTKVSKEMKLPVEDIQKQLNLIIQRRNKIAHESDIDPVLGVKLKIDRPLVQDTMQFSVTLVEAISRIVK